MENITHNVLDFDYIDKGIYVGTNQCCQTHFEEKLLKDGIRADLSLEKDRIDAPFGVDFYVWIPVEDHDAPTIEQLEFGAHVLEKWIDMGIKIYAHCKNGHGRAPTFVAAYFVKHGMQIEEAIDFMKFKRPSIHLQNVQMDILKEWQSRL